MCIFGKCEQEEKKKRIEFFFFVSYITWNIRLPNLGSIETKQKKKLKYTGKKNEKV